MKKKNKKQNVLKTAEDGGREGKTESEKVTERTNFLNILEKY